MSDCKKCARIRHVDPDVYAAPDAPRVTPTTPASSPAVTGDCSVPSPSPTRYADIRVAPEQGDQIDGFDYSNHEDALVSIADANIINKFCKEQAIVPDSFPEEFCDKGIAKPECINTKSGVECPTEGKNLSHCWLDQKPVAKMTLLGRVGKRLAKLMGEGVLWLNKDGTVSATTHVPLKITHLWHNWFKPSHNSSPIMGDPKPYPYKVIAEDIYGVPYGIRGLIGEDSVEVWNYETSLFEQRPVTDFPMCVREQLTGRPQLELIGFRPVSPLDPSTTLRHVEKLHGEGIIQFRKIPTAIRDAEECDPAATTEETTIAEFVPNPTFECNPECPAILTYDPTTGISWQNAKDLECLRGEQGEPGADAVAVDGKDAVVVTYNGCKTCEDEVEPVVTP